MRRVRVRQRRLRAPVGSCRCWRLRGRSTLSSSLGPRGSEGVPDTQRVAARHAREAWAEASTSLAGPCSCGCAGTSSLCSKRRRPEFQRRSPVAEESPASPSVHGRFARSAQGHEAATWRAVPPLTTRARKADLSRKRVRQGSPATHNSDTKLIRILVVCQQAALVSDVLDHGTQCESVAATTAVVRRLDVRNRIDQPPSLPLAGGWASTGRGQARARRPVALVVSLWSRPGLATFRPTVADSNGVSELDESTRHAVGGIAHVPLRESGASHVMSRTSLGRRHTTHASARPLFRLTHGRARYAALPVSADATA